MKKMYLWSLFTIPLYPLWAQNEEIVITRSIYRTIVINNYDLRFQSETIKTPITISSGIYVNNGDIYIEEETYIKPNDYVKTGKTKLQSSDREKRPTPTSNTLTLAPNPVDNVMILSVDKANIIGYILYDFAGNRIIQSSISPPKNKIEINVNSLSSEFYHIKIYLDNRNLITKKFFKK